MSEVVLLPSVDEITQAVEPEIDRDEIILRQDILLDRWRAFGFEVSELLREPRL